MAQILFRFKILVFLLLIGVPEAYASSSFRLPEYQKFELSNGLTVFLMPQKKVPMLHVSIAIQGGSAADGADHPGLADFTVNAISLGSKSYSKDDIEEMLDFHGANLSQGSLKDYSLVEISLASKDVSKLLPMLADVVRNPTFPSKEVSKLKALTIANLTKARESPGELADPFFDKLVFGGHPYGTPTAGTPRSVRRLAVQDLKSYHSRFFSPHQMAISVVGDFEAPNLKSLIERAFSDWTSKESQDLSDNSRKKSMEVPKESRLLMINKNDAGETTFRIGGYGITRTNKDWVPLYVLNTALGGRFTSLLNDALRVKSGLTYGAKSGFDSMRDGGTFAIESFTATENTFKALDLALDTYRKFLSDGIDGKTLDSAKAYVKGQFPPKYETMANLSHLLMESWIYGLPEKWIDSFEDDVDSVTPEVTRALITTYFPQKNLDIVLIGKTAELRRGLKKYGRVIEKEIIEAEDARVF
jgi:zinc protease